MESRFKLIAAVFVGGIALVFHPWLESAYNSANLALGISGQAAALIWLLFNFAWKDFRPDTELYQGMEAKEVA